MATRDPTAGITVVPATPARFAFFPPIPWTAGPRSWRSCKVSGRIWRIPHPVERRTTPTCRSSGSTDLTNEPVRRWPSRPRGAAGWWRSTSRHEKPGRADDFDLAVRTAGPTSLVILTAAVCPSSATPASPRSHGLLHRRPAHPSYADRMTTSCSLRLPRGCRDRHHAHRRSGVGAVWDKPSALEKLDVIRNGGTWRVRSSRRRRRWRGDARQGSCLIARLLGQSRLDRRGTSDSDVNRSIEIRAMIWPAEGQDDWWSNCGRPIRRFADQACSDTCPASVLPWSGAVRVSGPS